MIETPTVLILGAGASIPYGYPSGDKLRENICHELEIHNHPYPIELINQGYTWFEINEFRDNFYYSGKSSIDAFLEHRTEFIDIGKLVIARSLIPHENLDSLFDTGKGQWYQYFYNKLNTSFEDFDKNKFSVITFNYDRSFEQFLFTALKNSYGKTDKECASKLKKIPIVHVHGKLADLDWQESGGRPYKGDLHSEDNLKKSADEIRIIHEDIDEDKSFKRAYELIEASDKIYCLGFGYNKTNIDRLKITSTDKKIQGTAFGLETAERSDVENLFNGKIVLSPINTDTLKFLRRSFYI